MESYLVYLLSRAAISLFRVLPRPAAYRLLDALAALTYRLDVRHRHIALVNLAIAFPELSESEREGIALRSFRNTSRNLLEVARMPGLTRERVASLVQYHPESGLSNYESARSWGRGILYLTGHFSAWELLPAAHALFGYPLAFVTRPLDNVRLDRHLQRVRESSGNVTIPKKRAAREILERLKSGGDVGILMDQNTTLQEGIFADFFGVPAATTTSVALFALRTDSPVLPGYLTAMRGGRYSIKFLPPLALERSGDMNIDVAENTRRLNRVVEDIVREQPDAWLWGHKRWKNQPPENPQDLYALPRERLLDFVHSCRSRSPRDPV